MRIFSVPRPNGSKALKATRRAVCNWLTGRHIPHRIHVFRIYAYFLETTGMWLVVSQTVLALALWLRWGWPTLVIALISLTVIILEMVFEIPLIARLSARPGENIIIEFDPLQPKQELILSAHYDSKTELLDHHHRAFFIDHFRLALLKLFS